MKKYINILFLLIFGNISVYSQSNKFKIDLFDDTEFYAKILANQKKLILNDSTYHFGKCKEYYSLDYTIKDGRLNGEFQMKYDSLGFNKIYGKYKNGKKEGVWRKEIFKMGTIPSKWELEISLKNGKLEGIIKQLNINGKLEYKGYCKNGLRQGVWIHYDISNGNVLDSGKYENGKMVGIWKISKSLYKIPKLINYDTISIKNRFNYESIQFVQLVENQTYLLKGWTTEIYMYDQKNIHVPFEKHYEYFFDSPFGIRIHGSYSFSDFTKEDEEILYFLKPLW